MTRFINIFILLIAGCVPVFASYQIPPHGVQFSQRPAGEAFMWGGTSCPSGSIALDGSSLLRAGTYANLFAVLSTNYGSVDGSHFNVPNAQGVFIRGSGSQTIAGIGYTGTQGTTQGDQFQGHIGFGYHANTGSGVSLNLSGFGTNQGTEYDDVGLKTDGVNGTPRIGSETRPANIVLLYCIVY